MRDGARELGRDREQLSFERAVPGAEGRTTLALPIERGALEEVPDGVYVQRIVVDAIPRAASERIYRSQRALYYRVSGGAIERIGMREYSDIAEPTHLERDALGREQRVNAGAAVLDAQGRADLPGEVDVQLESADRLAAEAGATAARAASAAERD